MGRVKIFDEETALNQATKLFWKQGYTNTSLKQLLTEMDMLNGSFYHCFKDKKTLFIRCLDYYNEKYTYKRQEALSKHDNFSAGIRALFTEIFKTLDSKDKPNGCLIVNSMIEEVLCEDELKKYLYKDFELFAQFLQDRIQLSIDLKHTANTIPSNQLAMILVTYIQGLFRISNTYLETKQLKVQTKDFLSALNL